MSRLKRPKLGARLSFPSHSLGPDPLALSPRTGCPPPRVEGEGLPKATRTSCLTEAFSVQGNCHRRGGKVGERGFPARCRGLRGVMKFRPELGPPWERSKAGGGVLLWGGVSRRRGLLSF